MSEHHPGACPAAVAALEASLEAFSSNTSSALGGAGGGAGAGAADLNTDGLAWKEIGAAKHAKDGIGVWTSGAKHSSAKRYGCCARRPAWCC